MKDGHVSGTMLKPFLFFEWTCWSKEVELLSEIELCVIQPKHDGSTALFDLLFANKEVSFQKSKTVVCSCVSGAASAVAAEQYLLVLVEI
jgi:hypothetical protein